MEDKVALVIMASLQVVVGLHNELLVDDKLVEEEETQIIPEYKELHVE